MAGCFLVWRGCSVYLLKLQPGRGNGNSFWSLGKRTLGVTRPHNRKKYLYPRQGDEHDAAELCRVTTSMPSIMATLVT